MTARVWFPDNPSLEFVPGKLARAVVGVVNGGAEAVNVTAALAALAHVATPGAPIFNFTAQGYRLAPVEPARGASIEYALMMPWNLPPHEFQLSVSVVLSKEGSYQVQGVFNETISVVEASKLIDLELLGLYAMMLAAAAAAAYGGLQVAQKQGWVKRPRKGGKAKAAAPAKAGAAAEWLHGTSADPRRKQA